MSHLLNCNGFRPKEWWWQKHQCPPSWTLSEMWCLAKSAQKVCDGGVEYFGMSLVVFLISLQ